MSRAACPSRPGKVTTFCRSHVPSAPTDNCPRAAAPSLRRLPFQLIHAASLFRLPSLCCSLSLSSSSCLLCLPLVGQKLAGPRPLLPRVISMPPSLAACPRPLTCCSAPLLPRRPTCGLPCAPPLARFLSEPWLLARSGAGKVSGPDLTATSSRLGERAGDLLGVDRLPRPSALARGRPRGEGSEASGGSWPQTASPPAESLLDRRPTRPALRSQLL